MEREIKIDRTTKALDQAFDVMGKIGKPVTPKKKVPEKEEPKRRNKMAEEADEENMVGVVCPDCGLHFEILERDGVVVLTKWDGKELDIRGALK